MGNTKNRRILILLAVVTVSCSAWFGHSVWRQLRADKGSQISYTSFVSKVNAGMPSEEREKENLGMGEPRWSDGLGDTRLPRVAAWLSVGHMY